MEYNPNSVTLVASDIQALAHVTNKHKVDSPGGGRSRDSFVTLMRSPRSQEKHVIQPLQKRMHFLKHWTNQF